MINAEATFTNDHYCRMQEWVKEKALEIGILVHAINGYKDHVHLLVSIPPKLNISFVVMRINEYLSYKKWATYFRN